MKWLKVFILFVLLHAAGWIAAHVYMSKNPNNVLIVADTSFAMKDHFPAMERWIDDFAASCRYSTIEIGTDKDMLGPLADIKDTRSIFRTAFGKSSDANLDRYSSVQVDRRILLSDGSFDARSWELVEFK